MSTAAHTPGPWSFDRDWCRLPTIFGTDGKTKIAVVEKTSRNEHTSEQAANARLIAAAPDLLAELKRMEQRYVELIESGDCGFSDANEDSDVISMRAAIAKAEGRS